MINSESSDKLEIGAGDNIEVISKIHVGDVVAFENTAPGNYVLKTLKREEIPAFTGNKYLVDRVSNHGTIKLTLS